MSELRRAYKTVYRSNLTLEQAMEQLEPKSQSSDEVKQLLTFLKGVTRGIVR